MQDSHRYRGIGRYTYEIVQHVVKMTENKDELLEDFSGVTLVSSPTPKVTEILGVPLDKVQVHTLPLPVPSRNIIKYFYYGMVASPSLTPLFKQIKEQGDVSVYFLPRHQIGTHKLADYTVSMVHDLIPLALAHFHKNPLIGAMLKWEYHQYISQLAKTDMIVTNSKHSADNVSQYLRRKEDIVPIYLGSSLFAATEDRPTEKASPINNKYFVYYGGYDFNKNIEGIMLAFGTFIRAYPEFNTAQLVFVGGQNKKEKLLTMAKEEGVIENVILTPTLSDSELVHYLTHSQGLFRLSFAEGFGLPELEALSLGVPVISSNYGPIKELFTEYAMLHDPKDTVGVVKSLGVLARRKSGSEGMEPAIEYARSFTWEETTRKLLEAIVEYVHGHVPGEKAGRVGEK